MQVVRADHHPERLTRCGRRVFSRTLEFLSVVLLDDQEDQASGIGGLIILVHPPSNFRSGWDWRSARMVRLFGAIWIGRVTEKEIEIT